MTNLKQKVAKGAIWVLMEKLSCQTVQFVVGMILARLLTPNDYGTVALTAIFFDVTGVLVDGGFGGALIQKKDADDLDFNSVFYLNLSLSVIAYIVMFLLAPWIAEFYKVPELTAVVRVSAVCFIFNAFNAIQSAELTKKMLFHLSFRISLVTTFLSAVCGIALAYVGYGVWALVGATLTAGVVGVVARWLIIAWRPRLMFSMKRLKPLFAYGWKMLVSALLDRAFSNLNGLLIGKFYTKADLAYVNKGDSLPRLVMDQVDGALGRVSFPALVQLQDEKIKLRDAMRRMMICSTFLVFPLMVGVAAGAHSVLRLFYGDQWVPAAPYMMLACFSFALWPFHTINLKGIMALGRSDVFLRLEIVKKIMSLIFIVCFFPLGIFPFMVVCSFAMGPLGVIINSWPNRKLLDYSLRMQLVDVLPTMGLCMAEAVAVIGVDQGFNASSFGYETTHSLWSLAAVLFLQFAFGAGTFMGLAYYFRLRPMAECVRMMPMSVKRKMPTAFALVAKRFA